MALPFEIVSWIAILLLNDGHVGNKHYMTSYNESMLHGNFFSIGELRAG